MIVILWKSVLPHPGRRKEEAESWIPKVMGNGRNKKIILILPNIFQYLVWVIEGPSANKLLPKAILRLFGRDTIDICTIASLTITTRILQFFFSDTN